MDAVAALPGNLTSCLRVIHCSVESLHALMATYVSLHLFELPWRRVSRHECKSNIQLLMYAGNIPYQMSQINRSSVPRNLWVRHL